MRVLLWRFLISNALCVNLCIPAVTLRCYCACLCSKGQNGRSVTLRYGSINIPHHVFTKPPQCAAGEFLHSSILSLFLSSFIHSHIGCFILSTLLPCDSGCLLSPLPHFFATNLPKGTFLSSLELPL